MQPPQNTPLMLRKKKTFFPSLCQIFRPANTASHSPVCLVETRIGRRAKSPWGQKSPRVPKGSQLLRLNGFPSSLTPGTALFFHSSMRSPRRVRKNMALCVS